MDRDRTFSIVGLGKLGASMAAAMASRGFNVIGVDVSRQTVERLNSGHAPVQETDLEKTVATHRHRIRATMSHREAVLATDASFVIVPTPSDKRGAFSLQFAAWAFQEIGAALAEKDSYHLVVLTSTVLPGATRYGLLPILEKASGKRCGRDFGLCYSPEFIALGSVIHDFLHPDLTLVGEFDRRSGDQLEAAYRDMMPLHPPCARMSIENAELTKVSLNAFVTTKITFANMLADLCERIPGGDVDAVTRALGLDKRIGPHYLKGGLGFGGPCFPRDNAALAFAAREAGTDAAIAETTDTMNRMRPSRAVQRLNALIPHRCTVAILGLAYKPFSHVTEESQAIMLARALSHSGRRVLAFDPLAGASAKNELTDQAVVVDRLEDCLQQADVVVVATPDPLFSKLKAGDFPRRPVLVVDFWRTLACELSAVPDLHYVPVGRGDDVPANEAWLKTLWQPEEPPACK
jgi:UDPglucose 6-dehydrogenase